MEGKHLSAFTTNLLHRRAMQSSIARQTPTLPCTHLARDACI